MRWRASRSDTNTAPRSADCAGGQGRIGLDWLAFKRDELAYICSYGGAAPKDAEVARIKAPLMIHHAELDTRLMQQLPGYEAALKANGKTYEAFVYAKANHGFHNDTTPRYDKGAAELSWERTLGFFKKHLA